MKPSGISGFAGSGKTTVANYIEKKYGYTRLHIAEPLRDMLSSLLYEHGMPYREIDEYLTGSKKEQIIPCLGVTSRHAQITLGTEWGREHISPDLWANLWKIRAARVGGGAMNDSVRFPNEEAAIRDARGFTILVTRPGTGPAAFRSRFWKWAYEVFGIMWGVHDSERVDRLNPDFIIANDGSLELLYAKIDSIMCEVEYPG